MDGPLAIQDGRHPVAELIAESDYVPNSTFVSEAVSLQIIT